MRLDSDKAFSQLVFRGVVATMRDYQYRVGQKVWITRKGKRICRGVVVGVYENTRENREKLFDLSGFARVEEWEEEARRLHNKLPKWVVIVKKIS